MGLVRTLSLVLAATAGALGCSAPGDVATEDEETDEGAIVAGTASDTAHPAVGFLATGPDYRHCTGTLIKPNVVLTAAHCFQGPSKLLFGVGKFRAGARLYEPKPSGNALYPYAFVHKSFTNDGHDLAYVVLAEPVVGVTPAKIAAHRDFEACAFEAVGYGRSDPGANDVTTGFRNERRVASICLNGAEPRTTYLTARGTDGSTCVGDSGGGLLAKGAAGDVLVAVVRGGDACNVGATIRFQPLAGEDAFIKQALAAGGR